MTLAQILPSKDLAVHGSERFSTEKPDWAVNLLSSKLPSGSDNRYWSFPGLRNLHCIGLLPAPLSQAVVQAYSQRKVNWFVSRS